MDNKTNPAENDDLTTTHSSNTHEETLSEAIRHMPVVGIGASAGDLDAFKGLFNKMPTDTNMSFVVIQHLDPNHENLMVGILSRFTDMPVCQAKNQMKLRPNHVYMIPPSWNLKIKNGAFELKKPHQKRGLRTPIDFFFSSLAEDQRERAICIVLSGTGSDGTLGLKAIKSNGGLAIVQATEEAQYDGMPTSAISTGGVDYILSVHDMPEKLLSYIRHSYIRGHFGTEPLEMHEPDDFIAILAIVRSQIGHDFYHYKKNTLVRRINRRIALKQLESMKDYVTFLREDPKETKELFKDLLIGVTAFLREGPSWDKVGELMNKTLIDNKKNGQPVRVWVPGCSSGEEAYTIAMVLHEQFDALNIKSNLQIFATDIDLKALEFARVGLYPESAASDIPEALVRKYYYKKDGFYQVSEKLRENVVFSEQNLLADPPFSKLDLITCRNLLIYLESSIQSKIIELFHFALKKKGGYLMLGNSETIGQKEHLFQTVSKKWRIFKRLETAMPFTTSFPILPDRSPGKTAANMANISAPKHPIKPGEVITKALLAQFAPTSVLINRNHEILYHYGDTSRYLRFHSGEHTNDLFILSREGITTRLRGAVHKSLREEVEVNVSEAKVKREDGFHKISFSILPITNESGPEGLFLISFADKPKTINIKLEEHVSDEDESIIKHLEIELSSTREELQNTIEEMETSNEELKASNEEIMSMNEELQSSNEELETSKEELQSLNEELNSVNSELQENLRSLEGINNDLTNLINSTETAAIFLTMEYRIKFYTPTAKELFNLIVTDINRPLMHITANYADPNLKRDMKKVIDTLQVSTAEVPNENGSWYMRKIIPYRTQNRCVEGIVITYEDITQSRQNKEQLTAQNARFADAQKIARLGLWMLDLNNKQLDWSDNSYLIFETERHQAVNYQAFLQIVHPDDRNRVDLSFIESIKNKTAYNSIYRLLFRGGRVKTINVICRTEYDINGIALRAIGTVQDISEQIRMVEKLTAIGG